MAQFPEFFVYVYTKFDSFITKCTIVLLCCLTVSGTVDKTINTDRTENKRFQEITLFPLSVVYLEFSEGHQFHCQSIKTPYKHSYSMIYHKLYRLTRRQQKKSNLSNISCFIC